MAPLASYAGSRGTGSPSQTLSLVLITFQSPNLA